MRAIRTACIGASRRCTSTSRSTLGPTASRTARTFSTACCSTSREMCVRHGPGNGSNLSAVKPRATVSLALARVGRRRLGARVPAVGVDADPLAARPAQQRDDRHAEPLAGQIPQRLLEAADRAPEIHGPALGREVVIRPVGEVTDVAGVAAKQVASELRDVRHDRLVAIGLRVALAPAVQAVGGLDLHEEPVLPVARIHDERRDGGDLHGSMSPCRSNRSFSRRTRRPRDAGSPR